MEQDHPQWEHNPLTEQIAQQLRDQQGLEIEAAEDESTIYLSGRVPSHHDRKQAEQIASSLAPGKRIQNMLDVERVLSDSRTDLPAEDPVPLFEHVTGPEENIGSLNPEFTGEPLETNVLPVEGAGVEGQQSVEPDPVFFPPTDPVFQPNSDGNIDVDNGFAPSAMTGMSVPPSAEDNVPGDEALVGAIQQELHEDATTADLRIEVTVIDGVARLRGTVPTLEDAENAESVASEVPGVREVIEELRIEQI